MSRPNKISIGSLVRVLPDGPYAFQGVIGVCIEVYHDRYYDVKVFMPSGHVRFMEVELEVLA